MLEHLGLGIVLQMEDNFTPQANKALDSMDRLQQGAEKMQSSVGKSLSNLQNLMLSGFSLDTIGNDFERTGKSILNTFQGMFKGIADTGSKFETLRQTMKTFFKDQADDAMRWGMTLASRTPFEIEPVLNNLKSLKAVGIDARKTFEYVNAEGVKMQKSFMEFVGDLGAFNPQQGMEGAMYALRNLIGGNKRSLDTRFDVNSELVLGEKWSKDSAKLQEQFVKFVNKLAPDMMKNLEGTFDQLFSNLKDTWNIFKMDVANSGAFEPMKQTLRDITGMIANIDTKKIAKPLGDIFATLWKPIDLAIKGIVTLVGWIGRFAEAHPTIAKIATAFVALNGVLLVVGGNIMKMFGGALILVTSLVSAWANLKVLGSLGLADEIAGVTAGLSNVVRWLGLAGASVGIFALAWHNNFMGIRDRGMTILNQLKEAWATSGMYLDKDYQSKYKKQLMMEVKLDTDGSFTQMNNWAEKIAKVRAFGMGLIKAIFGAKDKNGKIFFSEDEIQAFKNTGMLETVQRLVMLRGRLDAFFKGMSEGIGIAIVMAKKFMDIVLVPIKGMFKAIGIEMKPITNYLKELFGLGEVPMDRAKAEAQIEHWKKIGKIVGEVLGLIVGFKIVKGLTDIITSPFKKLFDTLIGVKGTLSSLKGMFGGLFGGKKTVQVEQQLSQTGNDVTKKPTFVQRLFGKGDEGRYNSDVANEWIDTYTRTATLGANQREGRYNRVYSNQIDDSYYKYKLFEDGINTNQLYMTRRPNFWRRMFGDNYSAKDIYTGQMQRAGDFGGFFNVDRYDNQLRLASQRYISRGHNIDRGKPYERNGYYKVNKDGSLGERVDFDFNNQYPQFTIDRNGKRVVNIEWQRRQTEIDRVEAEIRKGKFQASYTASRADELRNMRAHIPNMDERVGTVRSLFGSQTNQAYYRTLQKQTQQAFEYARKELGIDFRKFNIGAGESKESAERKRSLKARALEQINMHPAVQRAQQALNAQHEANAQSVFKANRSKMAEFLFGQRFYKIDSDANGNLFENTIARRGGIFRSSANDMKYNEEGDTSFGARARRVGQWIGNTRPARVVRSGANTALGAVRNVGNRIGTGVRNARQGLATRTGLFMNTNPIGRTLGRVGNAMGAPMRAINRQRARLGWEAIGLRSRNNGDGTRTDGLLRRTGRALFGRSTRNPDTGERVGGGLFSRVGRGLARTGRVMGRVGGAVGRGVGMLGRGAMMAMPFVGGALSIGRMAFSGLSNMGANIQGKDRDALIKKNKLAPDASDFTVGLAKFKESIGKMDFKKMWDKLKTEGKQAFGIVTDIAKTMWSNISKNGGTILKEAFEGIKGIASIAWDWIQKNGVSFISGIAQKLMGLLGKAFSWLGENGGKVFGNIAQFVIGTVVPKLISGVISLGVFIVKHIPDVLKTLVGIAGGILKGLWELVKGIFVGLGNAIGEAIMGAIKGLGNLIVRILAKPIRAIPVIGDKVADALGLPAHHGGLYMSQDEHPALIRKDETVLPPAISRKFDKLFNNADPKVREEKPSEKGQGIVDNSIKIEKVEIIVQADKMSRADAREQAKMILEELKKMQNERKIRQYA